METDYSKHSHFRWKIKWRLEHLGALGTMGATVPLIVCLFVCLFSLAPGSPPRGIVAYGISDTSFEAKWLAPLVTNGNIDGYYLYYTTDLKLPSKQWRYKPTASNSTSVSGLQTRTTYYFNLRAFNSKGYGPLSKLFAVKTHKGGKLT